jgi:hypothetical protein
MVQRSQRGTISVAVIVAVTMTLLFIGTAAFAFWAFGGMQDYKNNADEKIEAAVEVAQKETSTKKDNEFAEASKSPVKSYQGSATYGSVAFTYPKTYSAYVIEKDNASAPIDGYFHPNIVPSIDGTSASFALRLNVVNKSYEQELKSYDSLVKAGKVKVTAFRAAKVPQALGVRIDGQIESKKTGSRILLPLRDKTIEIWTESDQYKADFDTYVVPSISYTP